MKARIKRLIINPLAFLHIMKDDTAWRVTKGVPKDTKICGFVIDPHTNNLVLFIEHESFPEVDVNTVAPLLETEFRKIQ